MTTAMERTLRPHMLIGFAAAAGAAAMMSAAAAPTAHADDFTDVINAIEGDFASGQTYFGDAASDFSSNEDVAGLAYLFSGLNEDALGAPVSLIGGTAELLDNETVTGVVGLEINPPTDFADGLTNAEDLYQVGQEFFNAGATLISSGEYGGGLLDELFGADVSSVLPLEEILLGSVASF
jgi:hypothetical protein